MGLTHESTRLLIQLGLIIILAKAGGHLARGSAALAARRNRARLSFSRTDIGDVLAEKSQPASEFCVPILYVVMGRLVNWRVLFTPHILLPGIGFARLSGLGKILGIGSSIGSYMAVAPIAIRPAADTTAAVRTFADFMNTSPRGFRFKQMEPPVLPAGLRSFSARRFSSPSFRE